MENLRRDVWRGAIPLRVELAHNEVTTLTAPPPLFQHSSEVAQGCLYVSADQAFLAALQLMAPRIGYLPLLAHSLRQHFQVALPPGQDTVWLDYQGLPLKWQIPTGVLYDLLVLVSSGPWPLTVSLHFVDLLLTYSVNLFVHFRSYPSGVLLDWSDEDNIKWSYMNALKEAWFIMHGNARPVMGLSEADHRELWRSVVQAEDRQYHSIFLKLRGGPRASSNDLEMTDKGTSSNSKAARVPIRLYVRSVGGSIATEDASSAIEQWDDVFYFSRFVTVTPDCGLQAQQAAKGTTSCTDPAHEGGTRDASAAASPGDGVAPAHTSMETSDKEGLGFPHLQEAPSSSVMPRGRPSEEDKPATQEARGTSAESAPMDIIEGGPSSTGSQQIMQAEPDSDRERADYVSSYAATVPASPATEEEAAPSEAADSLRGCPEDVQVADISEAHSDASDSLVPMPDSSPSLPHIEVRIQGLEVPLQVPLSWLASNFSSADCFLHMCIFLSADLSLLR
eukprot:SM000043S15888  [mRNA]  locus=s43:751626:754430:- [translate_table: standard]